MAKTASAQYAKFTIAAGATENVAIPHEFVHCISATGVVYIKTVEGQGRIYCVSNTKIRHDAECTSFYITNEGASSVTVELIIGYGDYDLGGVSIAGTVNTTTSGGSNGASTNVVVATVATLLLAANSNRTGWTVKNNGTVPIYVGGATVTTATGWPVQPGESYGEDGKDALYAVATSGTVDARLREVSL